MSSNKPPKSSKPAERDWIRRQALLAAERSNYSESQRQRELVDQSSESERRRDFERRNEEALAAAAPPPTRRTTSSEYSRNPTPSRSDNNDGSSRAIDLAPAYSAPSRHLIPFPPKLPRKSHADPMPLAGLPPWVDRSMVVRDDYCPPRYIPMDEITPEPPIGMRRNARQGAPKCLYMTVNEATPTRGRGRSTGFVIYDSPLSREGCQTNTRYFAVPARGGPRGHWSFVNYNANIPPRNDDSTLLAMEFIAWLPLKDFDRYDAVLRNGPSQPQPNFDSHRWFEDRMHELVSRSLLSNAQAVEAKEKHQKVLGLPRFGRFPNETKFYETPKSDPLNVMEERESA